MRGLATSFGRHCPSCLLRHVAPLCPPNCINPGPTVAPNLTYSQSPVRSGDMWGLPYLFFKGRGPLWTWFLSTLARPTQFLHSSSTQSTSANLLLEGDTAENKCLFTFQVIYLSSPPSHTWLERRNKLCASTLQKAVFFSPTALGRWGQQWVVGPVLSVGSLVSLQKGGWPQLLGTLYI